MTPAEHGIERLSRAGGLLHQQLADRLRGQVLDGRLAAGDRLPSEPELEARYGVTRVVVRQAIAQLRAEGWVSTEHGRGSFVREHGAVEALPIRPEVQIDATGRVLIFEHTPAWDLLAPTRISREPATPEIARRLGLEVGRRVLVRARLIGPAGGPIRQLADSFIPAGVVRRVPAVARRNPGPGGYLAAITAAGISTQTTLAVGARMPLPAEADDLRLGDGQPLLVLWRVTYDVATERPVEATRYLLAADAFEVAVPLVDRRRPGAGLPEPGPSAPEPPEVEGLEADLDD